MLELVWHCGFKLVNKREDGENVVPYYRDNVVLDIKKMIEKFHALFYSHSIVAGGFEEMS